MKKVICGLIMVVSLVMTVGFISGLELNTMSDGESIIGAVICVIAFTVAGKVGGIID